MRRGAKNPGVMQPYRPEGCRMGSDKQLLPSYLIYIDWMLFRVVDKNSNSRQNIRELENESRCAKNKHVEVKLKFVAASQNSEKQTVSSLMM